ncbi:hypothetical protein [Microbacterium ulmi]|uniref:Uncharacterized protein n=1 Tax=Microbacterium ulmi TaxID=179095 RepID=A0A7Y2M4P2_9MICO|nr:hypothetical protein [Microbacterium ulmi]NII68584.1 hypothetical protein [Microbacterium ulmi]NNH05043.1 hypothetical protein [Microbacterium ulmi]
MRVLSRRVAAAVCAVGVALLLTACSPSAGAESASTEPIDVLCADPLVIGCDLGGGSTIVVIDGDASDERVTEFAGRLAASPASTGAETVVLRAESGDPRILDPEVSPPPRWEVTLRPGGREQFEAALSDTLAAAAVPGATGIVVADGWPSVTVETLDQFEDVFTQLSSTRLFRAGGTYTLQSLDEHLRIVHVPARTTDEAILEIIAIARDHPDAEVLLEAPISGPQYPTLYVSRLTPAEVQELDARLSDPRLATADVDGYPLEFVLGSTGEDGTTYVAGTFGAVPAD